MINRRHALKTIAGATVVGSLSGCVQLATQRTVEYHGTPAMLSWGDGFDDGDAKDDGWFATAVGVEARRTTEQFGITKEIVAHSWGLLYSFVSINNDQFTGQVATFTTPSIRIAGQELNPIKDLTVGEIGNEFVRTFANDDGVATIDTTTIVVENATGKKVLRAFRDAVSDGKSVEGNGNIDFQDKGWDEDGTTFPGWDGNTYDSELTWSTGEGDAGTYTTSIRFEKHDGDFVVLFGAGGDGSTQVLESISTAKLVQKTAPWTVRPDPPHASGPTIIHPANVQIDENGLQSELKLHIIDTNLRGIQAMVSRARQLIDETLKLLAEIDGEAVGSDTLRAISEIQDDLKQLDTILGGLSDDLQSVTVDKDGNFYAESTLDRVRDRSKKAAAIAAEAHERVDSIKNDLEEHNGYIPIAQNLSGIKRLAAHFVDVSDSSSPYG